MDLMNLAGMTLLLKRKPISHYANFIITGGVGFEVIVTKI